MLHAQHLAVVGCCFDAQQMRLKKYCSTNLPMSLKIFHDWQMGTLFDDLNTHVHNPEALVVGVVSDCPAKLLLGVQQTVGTPRSGICKVSNGQKTRFRYKLVSPEAANKAEPC